MMSEKNKEKDSSVTLEEALDKTVLYVLDESDLVDVINRLHKLPYGDVKEAIEILSDAKQLVVNDS